MAQPELKQVFTIDGVDETFESKADALAYLSRPKVLAALMIVTDKNKELSEWLLENQDVVLNAFDTGTIRRVTKAERKQLIKAFDAIEEVAENNKDLKFFVENREAFLESFRWPKVKRMTDAEKAVAAKNSLVAASDGNTDLADWAIAHESEIMEAYEAGKEKRPVSPKATAGLDAYRAGKAEEKRLVAEGMDPKEAEAAGKELAAKLKAEALAETK